ncbi:MAG: hypothetical protein U9R23_02885 [Candidatus Cloacimonadota bacterium]|nr:hypothetical protein [Candidatus Cloacimonadota bacterium]
MLKAYCLYSVCDGSKLIGYLSVISDGIADAFLVNLMVHLEYQYQGKEIGKPMIIRPILDLSLDLKDECVKCRQILFNTEL